MKWLKIDPDNLPEGEVLMRNSLDDNATGVVEMWHNQVMGYLNYPDLDDEGEINDWHIMQVTHYIPMSDLLLLEKE